MRVVQVDCARPILVSPFRLSARAVLLRLVAGPVTNHDSSARERRGHTTLGSGSGACCHPLPSRPPPVDRLAATPYGRLASRPPAQLLRFATKSAATRRAAALVRTRVTSCLILRTAKRDPSYIRARSSRSSRSFFLLFLSTRLVERV